MNPRKPSLACVVAIGWLLTVHPASPQGCQPSDTTACFQSGRFRVEAVWREADQDPFSLPGTPVDGIATVVDLGLVDTAAFALAEPGTPEILVRVLDGRGINGSFWVFVMATSSLGLTVDVTDTETQAVQSYVNQVGTPFVTRLDISGFSEPEARSAPVEEKALAARAAGAAASCGPPALCLDGGRFRIDVSWQDHQGESGTGTGVAVTEDSGYFWLAYPGNPDLLVRMVDGRPVNGKHWFAAAAMINLAVTLRLTDTTTGLTAVYRSALGELLPTVLDDDPFTAWAAHVSCLGAARVAGLQGSDWHDRQLFAAGADGAHATVYLTPRDQEFDPDSDPSLRVELDPYETLVIDDLYAQLVPGAEGAGTLRLVPDTGSEPPLWRSAVYNLDGEDEYGMFVRPFQPAAEGLYAAGTTLATILSPDGFRDNIDPTAGPQGLTGVWTYRDPLGVLGAVISRSYPRNTTGQFSVRSLLGFDPEPGASLEFRIDSGSGRIFLSRNHNASNDPARDEMTPIGE